MLDVKQLRDWSQAGLEPREVEGHPYLVLPEGTDIRSLEQWLGHPMRKRGIFIFRRPEQLAEYVNLHKGPDTRAWVKPDIGQVSVYMDHHQSGTAGLANWGDHVAILMPEQDQDWKDWMGMHQKPQTQTAFAQFIEDHLATIRVPEGAECLEMVQNLEATTRVNFKSAERLQDGSRELVYEKEIQGRVAKGGVEIPAQLELTLPVFRRGALFDLVARLRYRIKDGELVLWVHLDRPQDVLERAVDKLVEQVSQLTAITVWEGESDFSV